MKKILFALIAAVTFATSITIASDYETSVQSTNYPQCDSYKPTPIECYWYNEGSGEFFEKITVLGAKKVKKCVYH